MTSSEKIAPRGYHASTSDGILSAIKKALSIDAYAAQIWLGNNQAYASKLLTDRDCKPVRDLLIDTGFFLISHSPYILNFARKGQDKALERYIRDLKNISLLGGKGSVLHMGSNTEKNTTFTQACEIFVENLKHVLQHVPDNVYIILENMAGGGNRMCCDLTSWTLFWQNHVPAELKTRIRWCIDTAHLFAAGEYNITSPEEVERFYTEFDDCIGWEYVICFHFNGSKSAFGSHIDYHADLGCGLISDAGLHAIAKIADMHSIPLILETPCDELHIIDQMERF